MQSWNRFFYYAFRIPYKDNNDYIFVLCRAFRFLFTYEQLKIKQNAYLCISFLYT